VLLFSSRGLAEEYLRVSGVHGRVVATFRDNTEAAALLETSTAARSFCSDHGIRDFIDTLRG
jgi:hypothetical protein